MAGTNGKALNGKADSAESILDIARKMPTGSNLKSAHLGNLAISTLKWIMLHSESDDLKYRAAETLLGLAPVRRKLDLLTATIPEHTPDRRNTMPSHQAGRLRRLLEAGGSERASEILRLIEQAEAEAGMPVNPSVPTPNPLSE
jgi:hypothetical protein